MDRDGTSLIDFAQEMELHGFAPLDPEVNQDGGAAATTDDVVGSSKHGGNNGDDAMINLSMAEVMAGGLGGESSTDDPQLRPLSLHRAAAPSSPPSSSSFSPSSRATAATASTGPPGHVLTWQNLSYAVNKRNWACRVTSSTQILHNIFGRIGSGECLAIMGPSGSGKSTLLDILAHRKYEGKTTGQLHFNGRPPNKFYKRYIGYVTQRDALIETLTVRETLWFASRLRLEDHDAGSPARAGAGADYHYLQRQRRIDKLLEELGLSHRANTKVGGTKKRGLSGGETKRVSIGVELICDPALLFLDEPTSGLDSKSALEVMELLTRLARGPRKKGVVYTIHQPRSNIVKIFENLLLISRGRVVWNGPARGAREFLERLTYPCEPDTNPADYFLDVVADEIPKVCKFANAFKATQTCKHLRARLSHELQSFGNNGGNQAASAAAAAAAVGNGVGGGDGFGVLREYAQPNYKQVWILCHRNALATIRDPALFWSLMAQAIMFGAFVGSLWQGITIDHALADVNALFFVSSILSAVSWAVVPELINFRFIYDHERASGMYRAKAYVIAMTLHDVVLLNIHTVAYSTLMFALVGFDWAVFPYFLLMCFAYSFCCVSVMTFCAAISKDMDIAIVWMSVINGIAGIFSGYFLPPYNLPEVFRWLYYISYQQWALSGWVVNNFESCNLTTFCQEGLADLDIESTLHTGCSIYNNITERIEENGGGAFNPGILPPGLFPGGGGGLFPPSSSPGLPQLPGGLKPGQLLRNLTQFCEPQVLESLPCSQILTRSFGADGACNLPDKWVSLMLVFLIAMSLRIGTFLTLRARKFVLRHFS